METLKKYSEKNLVNKKESLSQDVIHQLDYTDDTEIVPIAENRGSDVAGTGAIEKKVKKIYGWMKEGEFNWDTAMMINTHGMIVDGNNRYEAYKRYLKLNPKPKHKLRYYITFKPELNSVNLTEILAEMANFNTHNSSWNRVDTFETALSLNKPLAYDIKNIIAEAKQLYSHKKEEFNSRAWDGFFSQTIVTSILEEDASKLGGHNPSLPWYDNPKFITKIKSDEFRNFYFLVIKILMGIEEKMGWNERSYNYRLALFTAYFKNKNIIDLNRFHKNLLKYGFTKMKKQSISDKSIIKSQIQTVYNRGKSKEYIVLFNKRGVSDLRISPSKYDNMNKIYCS